MTLGAVTWDAAVPLRNRRGYRGFMLVNEKNCMCCANGCINNELPPCAKNPCVPELFEFDTLENVVTVIDNFI